MPKRIVPLSDTQIKAAKQQDKEYKLFDGAGLYVLVTPSGGKLWHLKYRFRDKEKKLALGAYPAVSLADARKRRDDAKQLLANGVDPGEFKKEQKVIAQQAALNTFEVVTRHWFDLHKGRWSEGHSKHVMSRLEKDIFPVIGNKPLTEIRRKDITGILEGVSTRSNETAHRLKIAINQMFRYAISKELIQDNPLGDTRGLLPKIEHTHMAAPTDPKALAGILKAIDGFEGSGVVKAALKLLPMLFCRPGELRHMEWAEIDLDAAEWTIAGEKMKSGRPHLVPLSTQAVVILRVLHPLTGYGRYVFPCHRSPLRCMSNMATNGALRRLGFDKSEITSHGFRASARTILDEVLGFRPDLIEHQLAHAVKDPLGRAYNRTAHLPERRKMMQVWADFLDGLKVGAKVIPINREAA